MGLSVARTSRTNVLGVVSKSQFCPAEARISPVISFKSNLATSPATSEYLMTAKFPVSTKSVAKTVAIR